ncbi:hypothetical protein [Pyxidicoccus caerfyrddinensis]|uniref:hypothetical protein n=1 Tax=Pyxidicoccus caerfyrddinensis TaxID=2709663 RepID=UPI001F074EE7|nr:hypothetical protein [Pyxidicoccus caerfyrddinensis]
MASPNGQAPAPRPASTTPGGATPVPSSTQIFGAGRSQMTSTQIFGSGPHPKPQLDGAASTPVPNTTQTFGAVQAADRSGPAVPPPPSVAPVGVTRTFGAVAAQPGNATQTFGAVPAQGSTPGNATQTFGAVRAQGSTAPGNATQTFGAVPAQGAAAPGNATQTFGAVSAQAAAPGNATQTFGAVPAQSGSSPGNTTQTFGAVPARGSPSQGHTQAFGAVPAHDASSPIGRTQTFGAVPAHETPVGSERVTGQAPVSPPESGIPPRSTSGIFPARGSHTPMGQTQAFGAVPAIPPEEARGPVTTQAFGAVSPEPPGQGATSGRTNLFGAVASAPGEDTGIQLPPEPVGSETLLPFGPTSQGPAAVEPVSGAGSTARRAQVELPPELLAATRAPASSRPPFDSGSASSGRERLWIALAVAAGLVLTAVLAYPAWRDRDTDMPAAAVEDKDRAAALLRRDDSASREQAIQRLRTLNAAHPKYIEAQAELAVAQSLRLSDLQAETERLQLRSEKLRREKQEAGGGEAVDKELAEIAGALAPLRSDADTLRKDLYTQLSVLAMGPEVEPAPALVARLKARAIHAGVTVAPEALALAERLRNVEGSSKTWSTLARAEYALSSGSPPDSLMEVSKELETLRQEDRTLLRAYVLGARLALRLNDPAAARSLLDDVLALNPNHQLASRLLEQLDAGAEKP